MFSDKFVLKTDIGVISIIVTHYYNCVLELQVQVTIYLGKEGHKENNEWLLKALSSLEKYSHFQRQQLMHERGV